MVAGFVLVAAGLEHGGALLIVMTRGMFNTLIPVLVIERGHGNGKGGGVLSSQASYSTWRDFGAAVGLLSRAVAVSHRSARGPLWRAWPWGWASAPGC